MYGTDDRGGEEVMMYYLHELRETFQVFNVFQYITFRAASAGIVSFILCVLFGERVIRELIALKLGQPLRTVEEVDKLSELHESKGGTPTMGGALLLGSVLISTVLWARPTNPFIQAMVVVMVGMGGLGFLDDYLKIKHKNSAGISARVKLGAQAGIAAAVGIFLVLQPDPETSGYIKQLHVPFYKHAVIDDMGWFSVPFFVLVIVGCSNAVNLTDGLDGLAIGCTVAVSLSYGLFAYLAGHAILAKEYLFLPYHSQAGELSIFMMAMVGAGLGFLWFNCHPAKVFMGDTGSLAIGGVLGTVAICCKQEVLLIIVGGVFVVEALSVILQVASFKIRKRRIFAMAPIHHHFELKGWHENKVITRFWILSIILALAGVATLKLR